MCRLEKKNKNPKKIVKSCELGNYAHASAGLGGGGGVVIILSNNRKCTKNVGFIHKKKADKSNKLIQCFNSHVKNVYLYTEYRYTLRAYILLNSV